MGLISGLRQGLTKTKEAMSKQVDSILGGFVNIDEDMIEGLFEILVMSDVGVKTSEFICQKLRQRIKHDKLSSGDQVKNALKDIIAEILNDEPNNQPTAKPTVIIVVGVNGTGKTTSIGKLAHNFKDRGKKVMLVAADTFRAAAISQLDQWAKRSDVDIVKHEDGADPAAVVFDGISAAKGRGCDVVICDTAGRLHTKKNLMDELSKIHKIAAREAPDSAVKTLIVLDATTGQNAINQAKQFIETVNIDGIILTKLDGTAKGGVVVAIKNELKIPILFVGVGEGIDDLKEFDAREFSENLFD